MSQLILFLASISNIASINSSPAKKADKLLKTQHVDTECIDFSDEQSAVSICRSVI